jgi:S-(hydroxymethyl)glutathione dehydrogenase/alcohol dehydrogenase
VETTAAVLYAFGEPHRIEPVELRAPGTQEILVRVVAAGVCHSDVGQADGEWAFPLPAVLGHEGAGVVEACGQDVQGLEPGQRVVLNLAPGCGRCRHCVVGRPILCQDSLDAMGGGRLTTGPSPIRGPGGPIATYSLLGCFAHHAVVAARSVIPLADGVPADVAALIGCAVITGFGAAVETIDVAAGSRGAVIGAGGVGVNAIQGARLRGAAEIVVLDPSATRREQARRFGATDGLDPADADAVAKLRRRAPREGFDWSIVTVGSVDAMRLGVDVTRPGAITAAVGLTPEGVPTPIDMLDVVTYEKTIRGSAYGTISPLVLVPRIVSAYLGGRLLLDELVSARLPLERIDEAFALSRRAEGMRPTLALANGGAF